MVVVGIDVRGFARVAVHAADIEFVVTASVGERHLYLLAFGEFVAALGVFVDVGLRLTCSFHQAIGHERVVHVSPVGAGERHIVVGFGEVVLVLIARSVAHGVVGSGVFEAGEDLVAHQYGTARIAHHGGSRTSLFGVDVVDHGDYVVHVNVVAREFHFGAQVVATIAKHGAPSDIESRFLIFIGVGSLQSLAGKVFCTAHCICVGGEVLRGEAGKRHHTGRYGIARAESNGERLRAGFEVHGLAAAEPQVFVLVLNERSCQHAVVERVNVAVGGEGCCAGNILLLRIYNGYVVRCGGVILSRDLAEVAGQNGGGARGRFNHLVECPAATSILATALLPRSQGHAIGVERIRA